MTIRIKSYKRLIASLGLAAVLTTAVAAPAMAAEDSGNVGITVTGGAARTVTLGDAAFASYSYSLTGTTINSTTDAAMTVSDESGGTNGWVITVSTDGLFASGQDPLLDTAAIGPELISVMPGTVVEGANTSAAQAAELLTGSGALGSSRAVLTADAGEGLGNFNVDIDVAVAMPDRLPVDSYSGVLTVTDTPQV